MAIKELFQDNRPEVLLDPRAARRIDPRFKFTRNSAASFVDKDGVLKVNGAPAGQPRYSHDPVTKEFLGFLVEPSSTNLWPYSQNVSNWILGANISVTSTTQTAPDGTATASILTEAANTTSFAGNDITVTSGRYYTLSVFAKATDSTSDFFILIFGSLFGLGGQNVVANCNPFTGTIVASQGPSLAVGVQPFGNGWYRFYVTTPACTASGSVRMQACRMDADANPKSCVMWGAQVEELTYPTSYIPTTTAAVTRDADILSYNGPLPSAGSVYIDARAIRANENDTLLSLKNSSNDKIDLAYLSNTSTYNSLALIANYDGTSKTSLPLPVPTTNRERNIITWGANNYQYSRDSSRFAASLSSSVPTGLNQLSIGHDAVDPTKAFNGYINTVYTWSGELTPAVAEALVRNELDPIDADTYSPTGPAGSLALVINTQGAITDGDKTFTLPAESAATDNDIVITWGDGTESGLDGSDAEVGAAGLTHTYPSAGIYPVWVEGQMEGIRYNNIANAADLLQIAAWGTGDMFTAPSTMQNAFYGCTQMDFSSSARNTNLPDTSAVQNWSQAFYNCSSITGTFPAFNFSAATNFTSTWRNCSSMTAFVAAGDQTQNVTNFSLAWDNCSGLTSFPQINTAAGTNFSFAWRACSSLTSFPLIDTSAGTNFGRAWNNCSSLTSFPLINTAAGTDFALAWRGCSSLTSFPQINTAAGTDFSFTWNDCSSLTSFPLIDTSAGTNFDAAWSSCFSLTSFPLIDTAAGTSFSSAWNDCSSLTSFPLINTAAGTNFSRAWYNCDGLTAFPALDFDAATGLASDASNTFTGFRETWFSCGALADFPANLFDNTTCTRYLDAFTGCALTAASIENILVSINTANTSNGNLSLESGTNAGASTWTAPAIAAYDALVARGWTITRNA